ncbi:8451_t:CDS:1, partial [Acaulospora morrowiae]
MTSEVREVDSKHGSSSRSASTVLEKTPKGIVLGKDGKPCRVCTAFRDWTKQERKKQHGVTEAVGTFSAIALNSASTSSIPQAPQECPPDVEQLGRATWTFLHTMAAYYPEVPSYEQQRSMKSFLTTFSQFYP